MAVRKNYHLSNMSARNYNSKQIITLLLITVLIVATFVGAYLVQKQVLKLPFASSPTQSLGTATYNPASKPWQMHVIGNAKGSDGVRSMDINGDNFPDLVSGGEKGGRTDVFLHPGNINASKNKENNYWFATAWCEKKQEQVRYIKIGKDLYRCGYCSKVLSF